MHGQKLLVLLLVALYSRLYQEYAKNLHSSGHVEQLLKGSAKYILVICTFTINAIDYDIMRHQLNS